MQENNNRCFPCIYGMFACPLSFSDVLTKDVVYELWHNFSQNNDAARMFAVIDI